MLIWQIEAALERTRMFLTLASVNSVPLCFNPRQDGNTEVQRTQSDWLDLAREKLAESDDSWNRPSSPTNLTSPTGTIGNRPNTLAPSKRATQSATTVATTKSIVCRLKSKR